MTEIKLPSSVWVSQNFCLIFINILKAHLTNSVNISFICFPNFTTQISTSLLQLKPLFLGQAMAATHTKIPISFLSDFNLYKSR